MWRTVISGSAVTRKSDLTNVYYSTPAHALTTFFNESWRLRQLFGSYSCALQALLLTQVGVPIFDRFCSTYLRFRIRFEIISSLLITDFLPFSDQSVIVVFLGIPRVFTTDSVGSKVLCENDPLLIEWDILVKKYWVATLNMEWLPGHFLTQFIKLLTDKINELLYIPIHSMESHKKIEVPDNTDALVKPMRVFHVFVSTTCSVSHIFTPSICSFKTWNIVKPIRAGMKRNVFCCMISCARSRFH